MFNSPVHTNSGPDGDAVLVPHLLTAPTVQQYGPKKFGVLAPLVPELPVAPEVPDVPSDPDVPEVV